MKEVPRMAYDLVVKGSKLEAMSPFMVAFMKALAQGLASPAAGYFRVLVPTRA